MILLVATACGDADREPVDLATDAEGINVTGKEFWSTRVIDGGDERALVEGTRISLRFEAGELSIHAGCNSMGGAYSIDGDRLVLDEVFQTAMGCEPERHDQDDFVIGVLTGRPALTVGTDTLTVATSTVAIELLDREVAEIDEPLVGTEWTVDGFFDPLAATSYAAETPATITLGEDGRATGFDGCDRYDIAYRATDLAITFAEAPTGSCSEYASAFAAVLSRGTLTFSIQGPRLTLTGEDGTGLDARAD